MQFLNHGDKYYGQNIDDSKKRGKSSGRRGLKEVAHMDIGKNSIPGSGNSKCEGLGVGT